MKQDWKYIESTRKPRAKNKCVIDGCDRPQQARLRHCSSHHYALRKYGDPLHPLRQRSKGVPLEERFWSRVNKSGGYPDFTDPLVRVTRAHGECWVWTGALTGGYGRIRADGFNSQAHRVSLALHGVSVAADLQVDHLCRRTACVRPDHLEPVTQQENRDRGRLARRGPKNQDGCPHGHLWADVPPMIDKKRGTKLCRVCARERSRLAYAAKKQLAFTKN